MGAWFFVARISAELLPQFRSVRVLRVSPFMLEVGLYFQKNDGKAIFPILEEVELSIWRLRRCSDEYQRHGAEELAAFEPCERAGRLVKVYLCRRGDVSMDVLVVT